MHPGPCLLCNIAHFRPQARHRPRRTAMDTAILPLPIKSAAALLLSAFLASTPQSSLASDPLANDGITSISAPELKSELKALSPDVRSRVTSDKAAVARFAADILQDRRIAEAAVAAGIDKSEEIKAQIRKAARETINRKYMNDEIAKATRSLPDFRALAQEQFETNKSSYVVPEAVRVSHILIRVDVEDERRQEPEMREKALMVLGKIKDGGDFSELAKQYSDDTGSGSKGGEIPGWVERGKTVPPFEKKAFEMKPGELSGLVRSRFGFHIIKLHEHRKASQQAFSAVEPQLVAKLKQDFLSARREEVIKRYASTQPVEITDQFLDALKGD